MGGLNQNCVGGPSGEGNWTGEWVGWRGRVCVDDFVSLSEFLDRCSAISWNSDIEFRISSFEIRVVSGLDMNCRFDLDSITDIALKRTFWFRFLSRFRAILICTFRFGFPFRLLSSMRSRCDFRFQSCWKYAAKNKIVIVPLGIYKFSWLSASWIDCSIDWSIHRSIDRLVDWSADRLIMID